MVEPARLVVCHTRDRPESLAETLRKAAAHLSLTPEDSRASLLLVDDSTAGEHRRANRAILRELRGVGSEYFGAGEHAALESARVEELGVGAADLERFTRPLGSAARDPAAARNAAFLAVLMRRPVPDVVVTLDDDVALPSAAHDCLGTLAGLVERDPALVCSATLTGRPDASLFFRALAELGSLSEAPPAPPVPVRSGLMTFHSRRLRDFPFPRCYSEDWVWALVLAAAGAELRRVPLLAVHTGERELAADPEVLRRECLGEALVSGFGRLAGAGDPLGPRSPLRSVELWAEVLAEEVRQTEELVRGVERAGAAGEILEWTLAMLRTLAPEELRSLARDYLDGLPVWRRITRRLAGASSS